MRAFYESFSAEEFYAAWDGIKPSFPATPRISIEGIKRNLEFIRDIEGRELNVKAEECFTNSVVDAVESSFK